MTYWSRDLGPYVWHEFDPERMRHDLAAMSAAGIRSVRTLLPWDVFMPRAAPVDARELRNFERLLQAAEHESLRVIPVLFAQSVGDCVMLPPYAIDVGAPRAGVRTVSGGVVQPGGPRDQYTDPRLLEAEVTWLDTMLDAFAGSPVIAMWDLGHDPASTVRPRRIDDLRRWVELHARRVHERGERCVLTLGAGDVTTARGVRLDAVAAALDALGLAISSTDLTFAPPGSGARPVAFLARLAMRLAGGSVALHAHAGPVAGIDAGGAAARAEARDVVAALTDAGCAGLEASAWSDGSDRAAAYPPFDRRPALLRQGLVGDDGQRTRFGEGWLDAMSTEIEQHPPAPWPPSVDAADYYANLPHSVDDLYAGWQAVSGDHPGMLA